MPRSTISAPYTSAARAGAIAPASSAFIITATASEFESAASVRAPGKCDSR